MLITDLDCYKSSTNYKSKYSGMDSPQWITNNPKESVCTLEEFYAYPVQNFDYTYNKWGFRGPDYSQYIGQPVNICLGDSFTVNLGGPISHSWPSQIAKNFPIPTLNLGMDGAGNDAIYLLYIRACDLFDVQFIFVMYSYLHRRLQDGKFIQSPDNDNENFDYFYKHRLPNAIECTLPEWNWTETEKHFFEEEDIYYLKIPSHFAEYKDIDRNYINEKNYNYLRGSDWPTLEQFKNGADPHPDMLLKKYGTFLSNKLYTNRDGHHNNYDTNKKYANYLYGRFENG